MGISGGAAIAIGSLAAGLGTGITQNVASGNPKGAAVAAGLSSKPKTPDVLKPIDNIKPLPTIDDAAVKAAKNNQLLTLQQRSGRASTNLSSTQGTKTTFGS